VPRPDSAGRLRPLPLFFQRGNVLLGLGLLLGITSLVVVTRAVQADAEFTAETTDSGSASSDAFSFQQMIGQFLVGPVGPVESLLGRPFDDPAFEFVGQLGWNVAGLARSLAWSEAVEATFEVGVEPALDG
jgi:hypothetical protein